MLNKSLILDWRKALCAMTAMKVCNVTDECLHMQNDVEFMRKANKPVTKPRY